MGYNVNTKILKNYMDIQEPIPENPDLLTR